MTLPDQLLNNLRKPRIEGRIVSASEGGDRFAARVDTAGSLALSLWELRLATDQLAGASIDRVKAIALRLTERVTYLMEPIQPIEADDEACIVQLRSTQPDRRSGAASYYELLVKTGGSLSLCRYEKPQGALRQEITMSLTNEVVHRLAEDFLASL